MMEEGGGGMLGIGGWKGKEVNVGYLEEGE